MDINRGYMLVVMDKLKQDILAKEYDYGCNGAKVDIALGSKEVDILIMALDGSFDKLDNRVTIEDVAKELGCQTIETTMEWLNTLATLEKCGYGICKVEGDLK